MQPHKNSAMKEIVAVVSDQANMVFIQSHPWSNP